MTTWLTSLAEALHRPGVLSVPGVRRERACAQDLRRYFNVLGARVQAANLGEVAKAGSSEIALAIVDHKLAGITRVLRPLLLAVLAQHLQAALLEGDRVAPDLEDVTEAEGDYAGGPDPLSGLPPSVLAGDAIKRGLRPVLKQIDDLGLTGLEAAEYAAQHAAQLVVGIDETTRSLMREAIARGIREKLGVDGLARLIRREVLHMSRYRSKMIASTEMNDAFSEAAMRKMERRATEYKRLIAAPDACETCRRVAARGPIPRNAEMAKGKTRTPLHPWCRCATVPSRPPGYKGGTATATRAPRAKRVTLGS